MDSKAHTTTPFYNTNSDNNEKEKPMNRYEDLDVSNPCPRCPVILLLDTSGSMSGAPVDELNRGLSQFIQETTADEAASRSVELEVITFDDSAEVALPFTAINDVDPEFDPLEADGMTSMGAALRLAAQHLHERRKLYRNAGISSYRPWVILMTDGGPNDDWEQSATEMRTLGEQGNIQYLGIAIGDNADLNILNNILPSQPGPIRLQGLRFRQFFRWLTDSLKSVSASAVSQQDDVQFHDITDWGDL